MSDGMPERSDEPPVANDGSWAAIILNVRSFAVLFFFVVGLGGAYMLGSRLSDGEAQAQLKTDAQVGFLAPEIVLTSLDGQAMSLSSLRGQVVLVNMWATWCGPCRSEMPAINRIYRSYRAAGLSVLAVNATSQDSEASARSFVQSQGLVFPVLLDRDGSASSAYHLRSLPTSYFVGRDGVIREIVVGSMTEAMLEARIKRLLAEGQ